MGKRETGLAPEVKHVGLGKHWVYDDPVFVDHDYTKRESTLPIEDFSPLQVESILQSIAPMEYSRILHAAIATQINSRWRDTACPNFNEKVGRIFSTLEPEKDEDPQVLLGRKIIQEMRALRVMENVSSVGQVLNVQGVGSGWFQQKDTARHRQTKVDLYNNLRALVKSGFLNQDGDHNPLKFDHLDNCFHRYTRLIRMRNSTIDLTAVGNQYKQSKENESVAILLDFFMLADREIYSAPIIPNEVTVAEKTFIAKGDRLTGKANRALLKEWFEEVSAAMTEAGDKVISSTEDLMTDYLLVGKNPFVEEGSDDVSHLSSKALVLALKRLKGEASRQRRNVILFELLRRNVQPLTRVLDKFVIPGMTRPDTFTLIASDGADFGIERRTRINVDHLLFDHLSDVFQQLKNSPASKYQPTLQVVFGEHKVGSDFQAALNEARLDNNIRIAQFLFMLYVRTRKNAEKFDDWLGNEKSSFSLLTKSGALSIVSKTNILVQGEKLAQSLKQMQKLSDGSAVSGNVTHLSGAVAQQIGKPGLYTTQREFNPFKNPVDMETIRGAFRRYLKKVENKGEQMMSLVDLSTLKEGED